MLVTRESKLSEVFKTPSGHDLLARLFYSLGMDESIIEKTFIKNIKLKSLKYLTFNKFNDEAIDAFVSILNSFDFDGNDGECDIKPKWWKEAVFYQIYPRSFKDSNNDGIGDINGIISKLDYLKDLGVDALWICPFFDSPNTDNGYDIRDYKKIMNEFGTMEDVDNLIEKAHKRNIKIIIDMVMNHTSDEHEWFKKSVENIKPYDDYYIWNDKPLNWTSFFAGSAFEYYKQRDKYVLHLFAKKQIDLNWDNPKVRKEMYDIANYWLDKGVDGFRLDVVSMISKEKPLSDGNKTIGDLIGFTGIEHYFHGPNLDKYLNEFYNNCLKPHNAYTVGECPGAGTKVARYITGEDCDELTQLFSFDHLENPGKKRFDLYKFDFRKVSRELVRWQENYSNHCWPTVFFNNHDNPRMLSKVDPMGLYSDVLAKMLVTMQMSLKGTPYIYQGDEIGMVNFPFSSVSQFRDVESINAYNHYVDFLKNKKDYVLKRLSSGSRDHARTPMQWDDSVYGGFSSSKPWIEVNPNYVKCNVKQASEDNDSILHYYKMAIKLRKEHKALIYGDFIRQEANKNLLVYKRELAKEEYLIIINLTSKQIKNPYKSGEIILHNYKDITDKLRPYEALIVKPN